MILLIALREFPGHGALGEPQVEPDRFPELREQSSESKETKTIRVHRTEYWRGENPQMDSHKSAERFCRVCSRGLIRA